MPIPVPTLKTYEKTSLDLAIEAFAKHESPGIAELNCVRTQADLKDKIDSYRFGALAMTEENRETEGHDSARMAELMELCCDPRPAAAEYCHCHAIVSGAHNEAATIRAVLAWALLRIDDPRNGCWLPRNTAARVHMPLWLKNAVPHSRIHRKSYYRWLGDLINPTMIKSPEDLVRTLKTVRMRLQYGAVPKNILEEMRLQ
ncbi:AHH domain-containing protein [Teredinibacter turnerae]|uniref:AHH domain-containing protein n=1 Tax=Teredinibacter turnerae TaxID=2426 RepID=UPI0030D48282